MRRLALAGLVSLLLVVGVPAVGLLASAAPSVELTKVDGTRGLTAMTARPGTRTLYLAAQDGVVWSLRNGTRASDPVVDLSNRVSQDGGERGLLGLAFSPDGTKLYVDYTDRDGNTQVDELTMRGRNADASTRRNVLEVDQPQPNHNGGQLAFGPDGDLYIGLGDGGGAGDSGEGHAPGGNGQSLGTLLGKILRIDPTPSGSAAYQVPSDNPFVATAGARPEIWAYGLRNPWRSSFDTSTGDLWIGDVGQDEWEEIDHVPATHGHDAGKGVNFGWNRQEGDHAYQGTVPAGVVEPVYEISHDTGACAVVGGYVFRAKQASALDGSYVFSDDCDGSIRLLTPKAGGGVTMTDTGVDGSSVSSFGRSNGGDVYVLSLTEGVFRLTAA